MDTSVAVFKNIPLRNRCTCHRLWQPAPPKNRLHASAGANGARIITTAKPTATTTKETTTMR